MPDREQVEEIEELIGLSESTVKELKNYVRENDMEKEQLEKLLEIEKDTKQRKTAVEFLENRLEKQAESGKIDREELLKILGGTVEEMKEWVREQDPSDEQLEEILHAEKMVNDRKTAKKFLKSYSKKRELEEDIRETERDFRQLRKDLNRIEEEVLDQDLDLSELSDLEQAEEITNQGIQEDDQPEQDDETDAENPQKDTDEEEGEEAGGKEESEGSGTDSESGDEEKNEDDEGAVDEEEEAGDQSDEVDEQDGSEGDDKQQDKLEQKREIADELDVDMTEQELKDIGLEELQRIRDEKAKREELIEELADEFDEEKLRNASTRDLEKLMSEVEEDSEEDQKEDEEIREEAQEDLEMLMGAVKSEQSGQEESSDRLEDLKQIPSKIRDRLDFRSGEEEQEADGLDEQKVIELLEEYRELDKYECAIKTAHVLKGYLEFSENIDREMTYGELADEIEPEDEDMEKILEFFRKMNKDQYTGHITADMEEVAESAENLLEKRV